MSNNLKADIHFSIPLWVKNQANVADWLSHLESWSRTERFHQPVDSLPSRYRVLCEVTSLIGNVNVLPL